MLERIPYIQDDGLLTPPIGKWATRKYRLVSYYASLLLDSMEGKWGSLVYIDLFAGAGLSQIKNSSDIVPGSPLLSLILAKKFDRYVFCENDYEKLNVLKRRVEALLPDDQQRVRFIEGDCNLKTHEILASIPSPNRDRTVLSFCFVDPFRLEDLQFQTIRELSRFFIDFLVLIPCYMDANRNLQNYIKWENKNVDNFLGLPNWREIWNSGDNNLQTFGGFVANQFGMQMKTLGYKYKGLDETIMIRSEDNNVPLYRLAFFSRHDLGKKFWQNSRKYTANQLRLFN